MGRKPLEESSAESQSMDLAVQKQEEEILSIQQVEDAYGDGQPYERLRLENEIRFFQQQMADSLLETGKRLIRLKANEGHGGFLKCLENLEMSPRSAQFAMTAVRKFSNAKSISHLGNTKLIALSVLDDESIQSLDEGGKIGEVTLDDIERMTVKELKETLRTEREKRKNDRKAQEDAIAKKEEKINELERQVRYQEPPSKEKIAEVRLNEFRKDYRAALLSITSDFLYLKIIIANIQNIEHVSLPQLDEFLRQYDNEMESLAEARMDFEEAVDNILPTWNKNEEE